MWIKICGITRVEDAQVVASAGASAIGLNFYQGSKRFVTRDQAIPIAAAARARVADRPPLDIVGVFVNASIEKMVETVQKVGLTAVQFHGDESVGSIVEFHDRLPHLQIIRAYRVSMESVDKHLHAVDQLGKMVPLAACLLDAFVVGEFGGTGTNLDLRIPVQYMQENRPRLILAGGLTPENIERVLRDVMPWGVDTASGVELSPGIKDAARCRSFVGTGLQYSPVPQSAKDVIRL